MLSRVLVLVLVAMNIGAGLWWWLRPVPVETFAPVTDPGVEPLRLLSELGIDQGPLPPDEAESVGPPEPLPALETRECLQLGPWLTQIDLRRAMNVLTPFATRIQYRETREVIRRGYRVYLASPGSRQAALQLARQLSARGLNDYYVVTAGDQQNTVSLGLFRDERNAITRLAEVRALGFDAQMESRNDEVPQFWIDIDVGRDTAWRAALGAQAGIGSQPIDCRPTP